ncbi:uncharacterized protein LOC111620650 [Centruroides sculpturatus]|uniref:uncharacterized protein LOC111620650 n=1 Tax=Centruroides sculpturatus TaxID=218467 RepID=UPI000C6DB939|nr:uncharacterized protein LOC111620650 [Centruroides sculpturatus]
MILIFLFILCLELVSSREYSGHENAKIAPIPYRFSDNSLKNDYMYAYYSPKFNSRAYTRSPFIAIRYTFGYKPYRYAYGVRPVLKDYLKKFRSWKQVEKDLAATPKPELLS